MQISSQRACTLLLEAALEVRMCVNRAPLHPRAASLDDHGHRPEQDRLVEPDLLRRVRSDPPIANPGTVVAAGPGKKDEPVSVKVGDTVLYGKYAGTEIQIEGNDLLIMRESDILAII